MAEDAKKRKVSTREILALNDSGAVVTQDDWIDARGFRYTIDANKKGVDILFDSLPDSITRALAAFGGLTLAGNVTNTVRNSDSGGTPDEEYEALVAWAENLAAGNWAGPRGELEAGTQLLAEAYVRSMTKDGQTQFADGSELTVENAKAKLDAKTKDDRKKIRAHAKIQEAMAEIQLERKRAKAADSAGVMPEL